MTGKIVIQSSASSKRRQPLLPNKPAAASSSSSTGHTVGEVAGGAAAECAAVCCCCPGVVVECLILAVYKAPSGICRRIHKKMILRKKRGLGLLHHHHHHGEMTSGIISDDFPGPIDLKEFEMINVSFNGSTEAIDLDKVMWEQFHDTGFWRSPSQRHLL
ncbi:hypothetical protein Dimus_020084 [Dionaea muscipula]